MHKLIKAFTSPDLTGQPATTVMSLTARNAFEKSPNEHVFLNHLHFTAKATRSY